MAPRNPTQVLAFAPFHLDLARESLFRGQREIKLRPKVYALLRYLAERPERLISKDELLTHLWSDARVGEAVIKSHLNQLRRALEDDVRSPRVIETVARRGYRFIAPLERVSAGSPASATAARLALNPILVGREPQLRVLEEALQGSRSGQRQLCCISGEAGIGKTALLEAFSAQARGHSGTLVASGHCIEHHGVGEAYLPSLEAFGRLLRSEPGRPYVSLLEQRAPHWLAQMPELHAADAPGVTPPRGAPEPMLREMGAAIHLLTQTTPLVLILEDLHWADYSTLALLEYLGISPDPARLLIIASYRPQELTPTHAVRALERRFDAPGCWRRIELDYLGELEVARYLDERFVSHGFPREVAAAVYRHTSGNPLFMCRVLDDLVERTVIAQRSGIWQLTGALTLVGGSVPATVAALIERDVELLGPPERNILEAASVAGAEFGVPAVAAALERPALSIEDVCTAWGRQGRFIRAIGSDDTNIGARYAFVHAIYQQVIYARIGPLRRAELHRRLGTWLCEALGGHASPASLAHHFELGQMPERAAVHRRAAAQQAMRRGAYREAIDHYQTALELTDRARPTLTGSALELDLWLGIAVPLGATLGYNAPETERAYMRASELARSLADAPRAAIALAGAGTCHLAGGRYLKTAQHADELIKVSKAAGNTRARIEALLLSGIASFYRGRLATAARRLRRAVALYGVAEASTHSIVFLQDVRVTALCFLAWIDWHRGHEERAIAESDEACAIAAQVGEPFALGCSMSYSLLLHRSRNDLERCESLSRQLMTLSSENRFAFFLSTSQLTLASVEMDRGQVDAGLEHLRRAIAERVVAGAVVNRSFWLSTLARSCLGAGRFEEAAQALAEAFDAVVIQDERFWEPELYRLAAELASAGLDLRPWLGPGVPAGSAALMSQALTLAREIGSVALERRALDSLESSTLRIERQAN